MTYNQTFLAFAMAVWAASASAATSLGTLQSEGRFQVIAAGDEKATTFDQPEFAFFSGDTLVTTRSDAVLNLRSGGALGFTRGARVTVTQTDRGAVETVVADGAVFYAFPEGRDNFSFRIGNFTAQGQPSAVRSMRVARDAESVGTIELLADGNIKATVRSGALHIRNGDSVRYQVSAGESVGLLDMPNQTIRTQASIPAPAKPLILIQSPERVGTNEDFLIRWESAEPVAGDYVVIAESGAEPDEFESLVNSDEGNELEFEAPGDPGDYEIRFIDGETGEIKRFVYLDVVQDVIGAYWWDKRFAGVIFAGAAAGVSAYIINDSRDGGAPPEPPPPVSP